MTRYVVLGITNYGKITRLANRRGTTPNEAIEQAFKKCCNLAGGYDQVVLISVGEDQGNVGDALHIDTHIVREIPQPRWELTRI